MLNEKEKAMLQATQDYIQELENFLQDKKHHVEDRAMILNTQLKMIDIAEILQTLHEASITELELYADFIDENY